MPKLESLIDYVYFGTLAVVVVLLLGLAAFAFLFPAPPEDREN